MVQFESQGGEDRSGVGMICFLDVWWKVKGVGDVCREEGFEDRVQELYLE